MLAKHWNQAVRESERKPGLGRVYDAEEIDIVRQHPTFAYEMQPPIYYLRPTLDIPCCHHERWDGKSYPCRLIMEAELMR